MAMKRDFTDNLGQVYGIYVGGFAVFVIAMALLAGTLLWSGRRAFR